MDEKEVIYLLKKGDELAIKILFEHYHAPLCLIVYRMIKDKDQTKDIVQEVFIKLWKSRDTLEISTSLHAYLKRAVINTALNFLESASRTRKQDLEQTDLTPFLSPSIEQHLTFDELNRKANEAIGKLPIRTRAVFTLIRSDDMSYKEVAETLGISVKAVEKEMMKALKLLREALREYLNVSLLLVLMHHW